jgi:alpha-tubulin suppressor-like RCC1 family protein
MRVALEAMRRMLLLRLAGCAVAAGTVACGGPGGPHEEPPADAGADPPIDAAEEGLDSAPANQAPVITSTPPAEAIEDAAYQYQPVVTDDGPEQLWTLLPAHSCGGTLDPTAGTFEFTPNEPVPPCTLAIQVCDHGAPELCVAQTATISIVPTNDPPVITSVPSGAAVEGSAFAYLATSTDVDSTDLTWSVLPLDTCGGTIDAASGSYAFTPPTPVSPSSCILAIQVCDGGTPEACATQTTTVAIALINDGPLIDSTPAAQAIEDVPYVYNATRFDPDGPSQSWSVLTTHTCGGTIDAASGVFTFTAPGPVPASSSCRIALRVCDGGAPNRCTSQSTMIGITAVDDPWIAVDDGQRVVMRDSWAIRFDVFSNDFDPDGGPYQPIDSVGMPMHGFTALSADHYSLTYMPEPGYCNSQPGGVPDAFTYTLIGGSIGHVAVRVMCPSPPAELAAGARFTCARFDDGMIRCWGDNYGAQLGLGNGDAEDHGDQPNEMGPNLPPIWFGTDRTAIAVSTGGWHACAILEDHSVRCWGYSMNGQLGLGGIGLGTFHMGDYYLPPVSLGTGRTALAISAGRYHTCAILDNGSVKCWGNNYYGQLGYGDITQRGDQPGEMGDALSAVSLGTGRTAVAIAAGEYHTCAILDDHSVKCWGSGSYGRLGTGDGLDRGTGPNQMGDALPAVALGTGRTAFAIAVGQSHTCALLDDAAIKCWGANSQGELGYGDTLRRGDQPIHMGDNLPVVALGSGRTALAVTAGQGRTCALLDDHTVKCWGWNPNGELGVADTATRGDQPGEMGDNLPVVLLGTGRIATSIAQGEAHTCALLDGDEVKCWGANDHGQLGLGNTESHGATTLGMGDNLPIVSF